MPKKTKSETAGIQCPICKSETTKVIALSHRPLYSIRRRECENKHRFNTVETFLPYVDSNLISPESKRNQPPTEVPPLKDRPLTKTNKERMRQNAIRLSTREKPINEIKAKYKQYYKYILEASRNDDDDGPEGERWVRSGSDLDPGMDIGSTNFPHGNGYPNYTPKKSDIDDFNETARLDTIVDIDIDDIDSDNKKITLALYNYIKKKIPNFYTKFKEFIDFSYQRDTDDLFLNGLNKWLQFAKDNPTHANVPATLKNKTILDDDIVILKKLYDTYDKIRSLINHRSDVNNYENYPLFVSLYDHVRELGGYEEGGWWYDAYKFIESVSVKKPEEVLPAAEKLYLKIFNLNGKPEIVVEKVEGSQEKDPPSYS